MGAKDVWLRMATEGGRWKPKEIADIGGKEYNRTLTALYASGSVKRFTYGLYGVTSDCRIPLGVTLRDLEQLVGVPKETA